MKLVSMVVPTSNWTLHAQGSKQVPISGFDDKRQISMVLANTPRGKLLGTSANLPRKNRQSACSVQFARDLAYHPYSQPLEDRTDQHGLY